jgi:signal transduction histidine kinase
VAVIPIRSKDKIVGAIHLADEREEMVPLKMVKLVESLGALIGEGLQRLDMESDLINTQQQLAESKRLSDIGALAATVAHELRNPLGVMQTALYNIKRKVQDQSLDKHLANVEKKIAESSQIINNLLFYTRIKEPNYEKVALSELLSECMATATERFHDMNVEVEKKLGLIEGVMVDADSFQMKEVFNNILINAYQAVNGEDSRIEIDGKLCENRCVEIIIRDNGTGIEPQDLDRVFDPFFTRKSRGTGLGLAICRELVRLHKGEVRIESEKGKGTSVTVTLPIDA